MLVYLLVQLCYNSASVTTTERVWFKMRMSLHNTITGTISFFMLHAWKIQAQNEGFFWHLHSNYLLLVPQNFCTECPWSFASANIYS